MSKEIGELIKVTLLNYKSRIYTINILNPRPAVIRGNRDKVVITPKGEFPTRRAAAKEYGIHDATMDSWIRKKKEGFTYKEFDNEED